MKNAFLALIAIVTLLMSTNAYAGKIYGGPANQLRAHYNVYQMAQQFKPGKLENIKGQIVGYKKMTKGVARFVRNYVDWNTYAELSFKNWGDLNKKQKKHFTNLLKTLTVRRYADLFAPNKRYVVEFSDNVKYVIVRGKQYARVMSRIRAWEGESVVEITFLLRQRKKDIWALCDIYVEGVSKARTYRKEFRRIFVKKGYKGVVAALKRNTAKYK